MGGVESIAHKLQSDLVVSPSLTNLFQNGIEGSPSDIDRRRKK